MPVEPADPLERFTYYRNILDNIPEYQDLTRTSQQVFTTGEALAVVHGIIAKNTLRLAIQDGKLPGTVHGLGKRSSMIPRSALIVWLGRTITGYYGEETSSSGQEVG